MARKSTPEGGTIVRTGTDMEQVVTPVLMDAIDLVVEAGGTAEHRMEVENKITGVDTKDNRTTAVVEVEVVVTDRTMVPPAMTDGQVEETIGRHRRVTETIRTTREVAVVGEDQAEGGQAVVTAPRTLVMEVPLDMEVVHLTVAPVEETTLTMAVVEETTPTMAVPITPQDSVVLVVNGINSRATDRTTNLRITNPTSRVGERVTAEATTIIPRTTTIPRQITPITTATIQAVGVATTTTVGDTAINRIWASCALIW